MSYANVTDVSTRLGRPITLPGEIAQVNAWLNDVELMIRARIPNLDDLVTDDELDPDTVLTVEASAVVRKMQNPEGLRQVTKSVDDGSVTKTRDNALSDGALRILDDEWEMLTPSSSAQAFTITPYGAPGYATGLPLNWWELNL